MPTFTAQIIRIGVDRLFAPSSTLLKTVKNISPKFKMTKKILRANRFGYRKC